MDNSTTNISLKKNFYGGVLCRTTDPFQKKKKIKKKKKKPPPLLILKKKDF